MESVTSPVGLRLVSQTYKKKKKTGRGEHGRALHKFFLISPPTKDCLFLWLVPLTGAQASAAPPPWMLAVPRKPANGGSPRPDLGAEPGSPGRQIPGSESAAAPPSFTSRPGLQLRWGGGGASGHVGVIPPRPPLPEPAGSGLLASARGLSVFLLRDPAQQPWLQASSVRPSRSMAGSRLPQARSPARAARRWPSWESPEARACRLCVPVLGLGLQSQVPSPDPGERRAKARE